jgi:hypothetical protein
MICRVNARMARMIGAVQAFVDHLMLVSPSRLVIATSENVVKLSVNFALLRQVLPLMPSVAQVNVLQMIFVHW